MEIPIPEKMVLILRQGPTLWTEYTKLTLCTSMAGYLQNCMLAHYTLKKNNSQTASDTEQVFCHDTSQ